MWVVHGDDGNISCAKAKAGKHIHGRSDPNILRVRSQRFVAAEVVVMPRLLQTVAGAPRLEATRRQRLPFFLAVGVGFPRLESESKPQAERRAEYW